MLYFYRVLHFYITIYFYRCTVDVSMYIECYISTFCNLELNILVTKWSQGKKFQL
jgi:hypothetical protein